MGTRPLSRIDLGLIAIAVSVALFHGGCGKSPTTPDPPDPPPPTQYQHALTVNALTLHTDSAVSGTVQVTMRSSGQVYNGSIGQKITIATTTMQEESCDILITGADCLPREFTKVAVKDSTLTTNLVEMRALSWELLLYLTPDGKNRSWVPRKFEVYFNPDPLTGLRLDQIYIEPAKEALLRVQAASKGWIETVTFHEDGTKPLDPTVPPDGEIWVYRRSDVPGIGNITYPNSYTKVLSSKLFFNQDSTMPAFLPAETFDALFGAGQEFGNAPELDPFFTWMLNRPRDTNNYVISTQKETQEGIDTFSTLTTLSMSPTETNSLRTSPADMILGPGATSIGRPVTSRGSSVSPEKSGSSRPQTKERIRN